MSIADNIAAIEEKIQKSCDAAGRKREEITLMGVTKFLPVDMAEAAFNSGISYFGESRVKEAAGKFGAFKDKHPEAKIHLVGSLQRNKAKQAALLFDCIQSVDRNELIAELAKFAPLREKPLGVLLEMHTGEETKRGYANTDELFKAAELVLGEKSLKLFGLMTMAPFTADTDLIRASFRRLLKAQAELVKRFPGGENMACLSMGMSNDFEIAVQEGSTMLRIGSAIFKD